MPLPFLGVSSLMNCRVLGRGFFLACRLGEAGGNAGPGFPAASDAGREGA
jgi:hypothetical protein